MKLYTALLNKEEKLFVGFGEESAVYFRDRVNVGGRLHSSLDFQRGNARVDKGRNMLGKREVL